MTSEKNKTNKDIENNELSSEGYASIDSLEKDSSDNDTSDFMKKISETPDPLSIEENREEKRLAEEEVKKAKLEEKRLAEEEAKKAKLEEKRIAEEEAEKAKLEEKRIAEEEAERVKLEEKRIAEEEAEKAKLEEKKNIGLIMREKRLEKNLSITDVVNSLCIRKNYINAIEDSRFEDLPGTAYAIGFIRSYSDFLELDTKEIIANFKEDMQQEQGASKKIPITTLPKKITKDDLPIKTISIIIASVLLISLLTWYIFGRDKNEIEIISEPLSPTGVEMLDETKMLDETLEGILSEDGAADSDLSNIQNFNDEKKSKENKNSEIKKIDTSDIPELVLKQPIKMKEVQAIAPTVPVAPKKTAEQTNSKTYGKSTKQGVALYAESDSWIEVRDKNKKQILGRLLKKGETYYVPNLPELTLKSGNAGALKVTVGGKDAPRLGGLGKVIRNVSIDGLKQKVRLPVPTPQQTLQQNN